MFPGRRIAALVTLVCSVALVGPASASAATSGGGCEGAEAQPGQASQTELARSTVCLLNRERGRRGLHRLTLDARLSSAARAHTRDMVRRRYFAHVSRSGGDVVDRLNRVGYMRGASRWLVGENLAWGGGSRSTPRQIMQSWMQSPGHRRNILDSRFRELGIGVLANTPVDAGPVSATYTTTFGARS
jgi:uncharacterized protein YkwD